jgi:hypothetical protein
MDKVRFGRALGKGARGAAKSLWEAAEAAASPDPSPHVPRSDASRPPPASEQPAPRPAPRSAVQAAGEIIMPLVEAHRAVHGAKQQVRSEAKRAGKSMLAPVRKFSSVLWLEVTGTFFTLIAVFVAQGLWKLRDAVHHPLSGDAPKFWLHLGLFLLFGYFAASSFLRARRRNRR